MSLWFEIAVLVLLAAIAGCLLDMCFHLEWITKNIANLGTRLETVLLPRMEAIAQKLLERPKE
jgi:hypothetical protein